MITDKNSAPIMLILSRLKTPIRVLGIVIVISILGLLIIPGQDDVGNPYYLSFLDALFIVSYTATTIGFGEIPYPFTESQKIWLIFVIYTSVISWIYNIGSIVAVLQDKSLWYHYAENKFDRVTSALDEDFYILLGFGRTGEWLTTVLDNHDTRVVAIDTADSRISRIETTSYNKEIIHLVGDYSSIRYVKMAGIENPNCKGAYILGQDFEKNAKAQLICKSFGVESIVKVKNSEEDSKMKLYGANKVISLESLSFLPIFNIFRRPHIFILASMIDKEIFDTKYYVKLPPPGKYLVYSKDDVFLSKIKHLFSRGDNEYIILDEITPDSMKKIDKDVVGIILGGTDNENLIIMDHAREAIDDLFTIAVNKKYTLSELYEEKKIDLLIKPWLIFVEQSFSMLTEPMIREMLLYLTKQPPKQANDISSKIMDIYIENEETAKTYSRKVEKDCTIEEFMDTEASFEGDMILYTKKQKDDLSSGNLKEGDEALIASPGI
jgi:Trk K+ transport system NAD-binding subunit